MSPTEWLRKNLTEAFKLPPDCVQWLCDLFDAIQTLDDFADGDPVARQEIDDLIWRVLVTMPGNPFFAQNSLQLIPMLASSILKWKGSDLAEMEGKANAMSYSWRASYYEVVLLCICIVHGRHEAMENAHNVMALYGETYEDYIKEFRNA